MDAYDAETAQAWFRGSSSLLNEESPANIFSKATSANELDELKLVIIAALAFIEE